MLAVAVILMNSAGSYAQPNDAEALALLSTVEQSLANVSYTGIYTYEHTGVIDSIKVSKMVVDGEVTSRMEHLSGREVKPIVHQSSLAACEEGLGQRQSAFDKSNLIAHYQFHQLGKERIAGRQALMLQAEPRDEFRFGYRLAIDEETHMPLLLALVSGNRLVERFQFVEFTPVPSPTLEQAPQASQNDHTLTGSCIDQTVQSPWVMGWLPSGFKLVSVKSDNGTDMYSYSDGLSRVSVFVSALAGGATLEGEARRGATIVYLDKVALGDRLFQVSVVGEVPKVAAQKIATSVVAKQ